MPRNSQQADCSSTLKAPGEYAQDLGNGVWLDSVEAVASHILKQRAPS